MFARIALRTARMSRLSSPCACRSGFQPTSNLAVRGFAIGHRPPLRKNPEAEVLERDRAAAASSAPGLAQRLHPLLLRARSRRLVGETTLAFG